MRYSFCARLLHVLSLSFNITRVGFALQKIVTLNVAQQRHLLIRGAEKLRMRETTKGLRGRFKNAKDIFLHFSHVKSRKNLRYILNFRKILYKLQQ